jgi:NAD-dependent deacetylase
MEYATLSCFLNDPAKAWRLYRALGHSVAGKHPNAAHRALAELERTGRLAGIITQNVDGLHQAAGSVRVLELHGDASRLHCVRCGHRRPFPREMLEDGPVPACDACGSALKPDVVLFEEAVRGSEEVQDLLAACDLLLVAGTSAEVWPASAIPERALGSGARLVEFNVEETRLTPLLRRSGGVHVRGRVGQTLPRVAAAARAQGDRT